MHLFEISLTWPAVVPSTSGFFYGRSSRYFFFMSEILLDFKVGIVIIE